MLKSKKFDKISCPNCGAEYLTSEIFIPSFVFGKPTDIIKDEDGKILDCGGQEPDTTETYICDYCGKGFKAVVKLQYYVTTDKVANFEEEYVSSLHKDSLALSEE
jgi:DNA-directed RNA polymerase subunit RPC12/RpoP